MTSPDAAELVLVAAGLVVSGMLLDAAPSPDTVAWSGGVVAVGSMTAPGALLGGGALLLPAAASAAA
jgi:hypothetical protein